MNLLNYGGTPVVVLFVEQDTSGQSYKASTIVIYDFRIVPDLKIPYFTTLDS